MMTPILTGMFALVAWIFVWKYLFEHQLTTQKKAAEDEVKASKLRADRIEADAEKRAVQITKNAESTIQQLIKENEHLEQRLTLKSDKLDEKIERMEQKKDEYMTKKTQLDSLIDKQTTILSDLSWLSKTDAKKQLFEELKLVHEAEIKKYVSKYKMIMEEEAKEEWAKIIAKVLPRVSQEWLSEHLVTMVDLPTENMKGKIIGREWRNIATFEKITWVEVTIDDTPLTIKLSSYDPEKRYLAAETMKKLVKDGRINPVYIEKLYAETVEWAKDIFTKKGKETLQLLNIPMMKPEIVEYIWRFHVRYSYGQNLLLHSIEVARLSEMLANEMGLDGEMAKKAWLLHDIWKIDSWNGEAHTKVWWEILRKHNMHAIVVNTAEAHHFDTELLYPEAWIVTAADAISASRPGARFNSKEVFSERMSGLENLITSLDWVHKAYIMQAWREIMAFVDPTQVPDSELDALLAHIWEKVEEQLDYPGSIRIIWIRENKAYHYLR